MRTDFEIHIRTYLDKKLFFETLKIFLNSTFYMNSICPEKSNAEQLSFLLANSVVFTIKAFPKSERVKSRSWGEANPKPQHPPRRVFPCRMTPV